MSRLLAAAAVLAATLPLVAQSGPPDAIYYHGHILTGIGLGQSKLDFVSAIAMRDGIITATGKDESLLKTKGPKTPTPRWSAEEVDRRQKAALAQVRRDEEQLIERIRSSGMQGYQGIGRGKLK